MAAEASYNRIAVVGTGGYGWHFLKALSNSKRFTTVRAVTRKGASNDTAKQARIKQLKGMGVQVVEHDGSTAKAFEDAFRGIDIVLSAVGIAGVPDQIQMVDGALLAGVKWFIPSEYGVVHYPSAWMPFAGPLAAKSLVQDHLMKTAQPKGLAHTIIYTGLALDYIDPKSIGLRVTKRTATLVGRGGTPVTFTSVNDVVRLIVDIVQRPHEMQNKIIRFAGSTSKMRDLIKIVTGSNCGENLRIVSIDEAKKRFCELARTQNMKAFEVYARLLIEEGLAQIDRYREPLDNGLFPTLSPEPVQKTVERLMTGKPSTIDGMVHLKEDPLHRSDTGLSVTEGLGKVHKHGDGGSGNPSPCSG